MKTNQISVYQAVLPYPQLLIFLFLLFAIAISVISCAPATKQLPLYFDNPYQHPKFPESLYIAASGFSVKSMDEAEKRAKVRVSEQVKSQIESLVEAKERDVQSGGKSEFKGEYLRVLRAKTSFSHAEMIKIDYQSGHKSAKGFYAFATLKRAVIKKVLAQEYQRLAREFREKAKAALYTVSPFTFGPNFNSAADQMALITAKNFEIRAIGGNFRQYGQDEKLFKQLLAQKAKIVSSINLTVTLRTNLARAQADAFLAKVKSGLSDLGIRASLGGRCFRDQGLAINAQARCERGFLGPVCKLDIKGAIKDCVTNKTWGKVDLSRPEFKGAHTKDKGQALQKMMEKVEQGNMADILRQQLSGSLPL